MRDRDPCGGGTGDSRRDTRDDLERDAGRSKRLGLFPASAEHERVAAFQPDDRVAGARLADQDARDLRLRLGVLLWLLADVDPLRVRAHEAHQRAGPEPVVDDDVCAAKEREATNGDQAGIAGAGADEVDGYGSSLATSSSK